MLEKQFEEAKELKKAAEDQGVTPSNEVTMNVVKFGLALEKESNAIKRLQLSQALAVTGGAAIELGRRFGVSQSAIAKLGGGAIATYVAMKLAAAALGSDLPDYAIA